MNTQLDLTKNIFSLVILRPRKSFFEWLKPIIVRGGFTIEEVYFPEDDGVWIIPAIGTFNNSEEFNTYLNNLKCSITREEMGKFGPGTDDIPKDFTTELCDLYFEFEIRHGAQIAPRIVS